MGYNLEYWIGKQKIQTLLTNKPKPLCYAEIRKVTKARPNNWTKGRFVVAKTA